MKKNMDAEKLAGEALKSIDNIKSVDANEFIFTRIQNRLEAKKRVNEHSVIAPLYKLAAILLLFTLINIISFHFLTRNSASGQKQKTVAIAAFAEEYNLNDNSYNY